MYLEKYKCFPRLKNLLSYNSYCTILKLYRGLDMIIHLFIYLCIETAFP